MVDEQTPGAPRGTNITNEMRSLFASLGVDKVRCCECGKSSKTETMVWDNEAMWFVCPTCRKL